VAVSLGGERCKRADMHLEPALSLQAMQRAPPCQGRAGAFEDASADRFHPAARDVLLRVLGRDPQLLQPRACHHGVGLPLREQPL